MPTGKITATINDENNHQDHSTSLHKHSKEIVHYSNDDESVDDNVEDVIVVDENGGDDDGSLGGGFLQPELNTESVDKDSCVRVVLDSNIQSSSSIYSTHFPKNEVTHCDALLAQELEDHALAEALQEAEYSERIPASTFSNDNYVLCKDTDDHKESFVSNQVDHKVAHETNDKQKYKQGKKVHTKQDDIYSINPHLNGKHEEAMT